MRSEGQRLSGCSRSDGGCICDGSITTREDGTSNGSNGSRGARLIAIDVLSTGGVVLNHERLDLHAEGALRVVGGSTSPRDGTCRVGGVTTAPCTEFDLHGGLGVLVVGVRRLESADSLAIDLPYDLFWGPFDGVLLEA